MQVARAQVEYVRQWPWVKGKRPPAQVAMGGTTTAGTPLAHMVVVIGCNLRWWRFSFSHWRKHSLHRWWCHPLQLVLALYLFVTVSCVIGIRRYNLHQVQIPLSGTVPEVYIAITQYPGALAEIRCLPCKLYI